MHRAPLLVSSLLFAAFTLVHIFRLFHGYPLLLGVTIVPMWVSGVAIILGVIMTMWTLSSALCRSCNKQQ